jgi:hypothetical protein
MDDDYGYFGKGINGYVHYMQAQQENSSGRGNGGGGKKGGCLTIVLVVLASPVLFRLVFRLIEL